SERYASVTALAEDIKGYLKSQPISARPDTIRYRAAKFVRRNRTMVAVGSLAVVATVAGVVGTVLQARTARRQRDFAFHQLQRSEALNEFHEFLLSDAAPSGESFTVNNLLERAEDVLAHEGATATDSNRVDLLVSIGDQYSTQDQDAKAR